MATPTSRRSLLAKPAATGVSPISSNRGKVSSNLLRTYGPGAILDDKTEDDLSLAAAPAELPQGDTQEDGPEKKKKLRGVAEPEMPSKADTLRGGGFKGLAELEDMQKGPLGSTSALSGPGSRRMLSSPARSLERQSRRYSKFGPAGRQAASELMSAAAAMRAGQPTLRTEDGVRGNQTMDTAADNLASSAIDRSGPDKNEMPPEGPDDRRRGRRKALGQHYTQREPMSPQNR